MLGTIQSTNMSYHYLKFSQHPPYKLVSFIIPILQMRRKGLYNLLKFIKLISGRSRIRTQVALTPEAVLLTILLQLSTHGPDLKEFKD